MEDNDDETSESSSTSSEPNELLCDLIDHIFLPKRTPDRRNSNLPELEEILLEMFCKSVNSTVTQSFPQISPTLLMFQKWLKIQPRKGNKDGIQIFVQEVSNIQDGVPLPIYVGNQNCTLLISKTKQSNKIQVSTFRSSLPNQMIMSHVGSPSLTFPETTEIIQNVEFLKSSAFAQHLHDLSVGNAVMQTSTTKGNHDYREIRDVRSPKLVSDWLVGLLVPVEKTKEEIEDKLFEFKKKVRDQVTMTDEKLSSMLLPFRRCGMYMSLKVTLHLKLLDDLGSLDESRFVYKLLIIKFLADVCAKYFEDQKINDSFNMDLTCQMLAKLGGRVSKLRSFKFAPEIKSEIRENIKNMEKTCLEYTEEIVGKISKAIKKQWNLISFNNMGFEETRRTNGAKQDYSIDLLHKIPELDKYIQILTNSPCHSLTTANKINPVDRYFTAVQILKATFSKDEETKAKIWFYDTENYIKSKCSVGSSTAFSDIWNILVKYVQHAAEINAGDPVAISQMYLVALKVLQLADTQIVDCHPLSREYQLGIKCEMFDHLLLPNSKDMRLLDNLVNYFTTRDKNASNSEILSNSVEKTSFSVRYAQQNTSMGNFRAKILHDTENAVRTRLAVAARSRETCKEFQRQIALEGECKCDETSDDEICEKCRLQEKLRKKRKSVAIYERAMPSSEADQYAVAFEFLIPEDIALWRDLLAFVKYEIFKDEIFDGEGNSRQIEWLNYDHKMLSKFEKPKLKNIQLCSTSLPVSKTHYKVYQNKPDLLHNSRDETYVADNGMTCCYYYKKVANNLVRDYTKNSCFFKVSTTANSTPYANLQKYVESTSHTQNSVIAAQSECHAKLSVREFTAFGSLRAGCNTQLRNLYEAIYTGSLSLNEEPVCALILQTIWQVGSNSENGQGESHIDFEDKIFAIEFVEMLEKLVQINKGNYSSSLIVLTAIIIIRRIADLNSNLVDKCYKLMKEWRTILNEWIEKIHDQIRRLDTKLSSWKSVKISLQKSLLETILGSLFSYFVHDSSEWTQVGRDDEDIINWFQAIFNYQKHVIDKNVVVSVFMKNLASMATVQLPCKLDLEMHRKFRDKKSQAMKGLLQKFVSYHWSLCNSVSLSTLMYSLKGSNVLNIECNHELRKYQITFDLQFGTFLINGQCEGALPQNIKENNLFKRYFKDTETLQICQEHSNIFTTTKPFQGHHYKFYQISTGHLVIIEIQTDSSELYLLDPDKFDPVSSYYTSSYTHWYSPTKKTIYFRPNNTWNSDKDNYDYRLCSENSIWLLSTNYTEHRILSIHSREFNRITNILGKLEKRHYINVMLDKQNVLYAHLWRHNLKFIARASGQLESVEYPGFIIHKNQFIKGTLIGLAEVLLLQNQRQQILLVPHSTISVINSDNEHQVTNISMEHLKQPPYFVYEMDTVLKQLKPQNSKTAWLYLAALHAATGSPLPDPFTQVTGTEMAVRILQSACVWSCDSYEDESFSILRFIRGLSPGRKYYGRDDEKKGQIETVKWPNGIPTLGAYDGYEIIVSKLIEDNKNLFKIHKKAAPGKSKMNENLEEEETTTPVSPETLRMRGYFRSLRFYNSAVAVNQEIFFSDSQLAILQNDSMEIHHLKSRESSENFDTSSLLEISRIRWKGLEWTPEVKVGKNNLSEFLLKDKPLEPPIPEITLESEDALCDLFHLKFRENWLKLYAMATKTGVNDKRFHQFTIILSACALKGAPIQQIINLHYVSLFSQFPAVFPIKSEIPDPTCNDFDENMVETILNANAKPFTEMEPPVNLPFLRQLHRKTLLALSDDDKQIKAKYEAELKEYEEKKEKYEKKVSENCAQLSPLLKSKYWPAKELKMESGALLESNNIQRGAVNEINKIWPIWYENHKLKEFIEEVQNKLIEIYGESVTDSDESDEEEGNSSNVKVKVWTIEEILGINTTNKIFSCTSKSIKIEKFYYNFLKIKDFLEDDRIVSRDPDLEIIYTTGKWNQNINMISVAEERKLCQRKINKIMHDLTCLLNSNNCSGKIIHMAGISPRLDPVSILKYLMQYSENQISDEAASYFGALAVLWTHLKRINRLLSSTTAHDKKRELENPGHLNWSPKQYPQWLILELELNIMIRAVQVDVANQMINMPDDGGNGVTQLNMGEGKTSVIVPMLCSTLAQRNGQLCRVTVLSSMFTMNLNSLTFSIGGPILNRRVYTFNCKRDKEIDESVVGKIKEVYEECLKLEGVVLTLPEHRLSFRLLAYDKMLKKETKLGMRILDVENWLRKYARDVLDESDELFSVKYQLVYTVGKQVQLDGRDMRWLTCQKILNYVQSALKTLFEEEGPGVVEFDKETFENRPHEFSPVRLLDKTSIPKFLDLMVDKVLGDFSIGTGNLSILKSFLVGNEEISREDHEKVMQVIFKDYPDELQEVLLLSGYLRREVLCLALMKRWRVEYGINPKGFRKMAVPYRAKDVAAEKTEFGHPDLAILLTHLSYYYSGLDDSQLEQVFEVLKEKQEPEAHYSKWISKIPKEQVQDSISSYKSINMKDAQQKYAVFEVLKKHKTVIDFWLAQCVFFRECLQFPGKLVMTPWDLCYERQCHPVTGFSGTNDSSILLPSMISQQDLPQLLNTNQKIEEVLRGPENCNHKGFRMGVTCKEILETMTIDGLKVLIDAGALMLEYTNGQVAQKWLEVNQNIEAVVYFNQCDELVVKCRDSRRSRYSSNKSSDISFGVSPYQGQLEKCGIFLDDQHTRGTDLKFPFGTKACVTIASKMKRDKLIQACMRMRKLGDGHTVTFYLSHDAYNKVMGQYEKNMKTKKVLDSEEFPKWEICAEILSAVPKAAKALQEKYGSDNDNVLEFHERRSCPQEFPYVRLLSNEHYNELVSILEENLSEALNADVQKIRQSSNYIRQGYFRTALMSQWRTDYGINYNNGSRLATAKQCQVEFENPEVVIICTYLSYYYSGLDISQFEEVLEKLKEDPDRLLIYFEWLSGFPNDDLLEYRDYSNLKVENPRHVADLFEIFRKHKDVINYWLIKCVFPVEFKKTKEETSLLISDNEENGITTKAVLDWVSKNTKEFNDDGLLYWALAGKNYAQRLAAEDTFHYPDYTEPEIENVEEIELKAGILARQCVDNEVLSLEDMYGQYTENEKLYKLIPKWFAYAKSKLQRENRGEMLHPDISERFEEICEEVRERCEKTVPAKEHICVEKCGMMEEEQEKELEFEKETEVEEERHNVRPGKATSVDPFVDDNVKWVILNGGPINVTNGIERLPCIFKGTSYWKLVQQECWGSEVFATTDFISVIRMSHVCNSDYHLRPINYLISWKEESGLKQLMVISQYEVNALLKHFRNGEAKCTLHMFSMRHTENQDLLLNNFRLQLPLNQEVTLSSKSVVPLLLASGNLYFENMAEQRTFAKFLGLVPKPWSTQDQKDFENGKISKQGFRKQNGEMQDGFQQDPTLLVKKIVVSRHGVESEASHLMCLINEKCFADLKI